MLNRQITGHFLAALNHTQYGAITVTTPDGQRHAFEGRQSGANAQLIIHDWRFIGAMLRHGDIALAEAYRDGLWDSSDTTELFLFGLQNQSALDAYIGGGMFGKLAARLAHLLMRNTVRGSKKNIRAHYDLGNDFYALWLDPTMTYSSAICGNENELLHDAQYNKYDRIIERMNSSGNLLEIGCGWGGFAERASKSGDYGIKGLTISAAQHDFASRRVGKDVVIALEDYRHQQGIYDHIVSIEMFEAVGENFWPVYFSKLKALLAQKGTAMVQTITIADECFESYRNSGDAIRTFIFPGGMLPSPQRFRAEAEKAGLWVTDQFAFGQDYAWTLLQWLKNFDAKIKNVQAMGFDEKFIRMWRFYLIYCRAAFKHGRTDVMQWELRHAS